MESGIQKKVNRLSLKKILLFSLLLLILLSLSFTGYSTYKVLSYDKIYKGIYINGLNVSGMALDEVKNLLQKNFQDASEDMELVINCKEKNAVEKVPFPDLNVNYDVLGTAEKAYGVGRTGNIINRLVEIINTTNQSKKISVIYSYDKKILENTVDKLHNSTLVKVKEADLLIQQNKVSIRTGHHGISIDRDKVLKLAESTIELCKADPIEAPVIITSTSGINVEDYYKRINCDAVDAVFKTDGKTYELKPHVVGRSIDKAALVSIATELSKTEDTEDTEKVLPVIFAKPKITLDELSDNLFKDTLATFNTSFTTDTTNNANRGVNIRLAVSKIDGKILAPGDVFSFNDTVGERTAAGGYKEAHTYVGGKVVNGIGGGICQVSTTLYNAVLFSDLNVIERSNHYFTVGYVPLGRDAAVSYDGADFKFKNSTKWPIKLHGWVTSNNRINFTIMGTNESPGKEIIINPKIVKTISPIVKYIDNPNLNEGVTQVNTSGGNGYIVDTYKIVKVDKKVVSETKMHTSYYHPLTREIVRGTKKGTGSPASTSSVKPALPTPIIGVDDADNPPAKPVQ